MDNLKSLEIRKESLKQIRDSFLNSLRKNGIELSDEAICRIDENSIVVGIKAIGSDAENDYTMAFASEVEIYAKYNDTFFGKKQNEMNFGCSGAFNPSIRESYWRTIHAASILKNWETVCLIVNLHCEMYRTLQKSIYEANKS